MAVSYGTFYRLMNNMYQDTEEIRRDMPAIFVNNFSYIGIAPSGSSISSPVWSIIRNSHDSNGKCVRVQFQENISWDSRNLGW